MNTCDVKIIGHIDLPVREVKKRHEQCTYCGAHIDLRLAFPTKVLSKGVWYDRMICDCCLNNW